MQTLILGKQSAVIFLEPQETSLARQFTGRQTVNRALRNFLRGAGLELSGRLHLELFENEGRCLLFISPADPSAPAETCRIFRFPSVDDLMDGVAALRLSRKKGAGTSRLYACDAFYYLVLHPPFAAETARLSEFSEELPAPLLAHLSEHATHLSGPNALARMARHFR